MRSIRVTGELQSLPTDYKSWFFNATCGNGPSFRTPTSTDTAGVSVDILFSSPSISEGEIKLELRGVRTEEEGESGVVFATKTVKVPVSKSTHAVDLRLKHSGGDLVDTTAGFVFAWLPPASHAADLAFLRTPHLAVTVSAAFSDSEACEDLSLRLLNSEGHCLACGSIPAAGIPSTLLLLSEQHKNQSLELAVAGEATGVFSIPQAPGEPLVVQHCSAAGGKGSCLLVSTRMHVHAGNSSEQDVGADHQGQPQLLSFGSMRLLPAAGELPSQPTSMLTCFVETGIADHDTLPEPEILAGVVRGPLLSRLDLPPPSAPRRSGRYILPGCSPAPGDRDMAAVLQDLLEQCPSNLLYSDQHSALSSEGQMTARVSILAVEMCSTDEEDDAPCARLVASCLLSEALRSAATTKNEPSPPTDDDSLEEGMAVLLRGVVENVTEVQQAPAPVSRGDTVELACAVLPVGSVEVKPAEDTPRVSTAVSLKSSHAVKLELEPAKVQELSQQSNAQVQSSELGAIQLKADEFKVDKLSTGSEQQLVDVLTNELQEKQRLVDRLLSESKTKSHTIAEQTACGDSLREEISKLKINLTETRAALSYREQESSAAVRLAEDGVDSPASLQQFSRPVLVQAVIECCNRLKQKDQECIDLKKVMGDSVSIRQQFIALTRTYKELQNAHLMQSNHIQKLHKQHEKVKTYQNTIVMQERVISKMQSVIESHLKAAAAPQSVALPIREKVVSAGVVDKERNSSSLDSASATELNQLRSKQSQTESEMARMRAEISSKDIRIEALQEQLTISAAEASREIANLRTRLFELEIAGHGGSTVSVDFGGGEAMSGGDEEMSASLSRDLLLVPFQESLQQDNDKLRREILSARTKGSRSSLASQHGGDGNDGIPDRDQAQVLTSRSSRSREATRSRNNTSNRFVDLSGTTHCDDKAAIRAKSISLADAYRASSSGGSPRPRSPSVQSSDSSKASHSARDRSEAGQKKSIANSNAGSRLSSKPNSRVSSKPNSRLCSPTTSNVMGRGSSPFVTASAVHEKDTANTLLEF